MLLWSSFLLFGLMFGGLPGGNHATQSFRKTKWILEKTFSFSNEVFITLLW